ncbi:MAG: hypothetical protein WC213_12705 [Arenimonas sp.]|jgi:hypothetical protein
MHWLYLLLSLSALFAASKTAGWVVVVLLVLSLILFVAWMVGWVSARISTGSRTDAQIISPEELRRLREQAEARKAAAQSNPVDPQA